MRAWFLKRSVTASAQNRGVPTSRRVCTSTSHQVWGFQTDSNGTRPRPRIEGDLEQEADLDRLDELHLAQDEVGVVRLLDLPRLELHVALPRAVTSAASAA